jgi:hypothetical protein
LLFKRILISSVTDIYCSLIDDNYFIDKKNTLVDSISLASTKSTVDDRARIEPTFSGSSSVRFGSSFFSKTRFGFGSVRIHFSRVGSGSVRFECIFKKSVRVRFGSSTFPKIRFGLNCTSIPISIRYFSNLSFYFLFT